MAIDEHEKRNLYISWGVFFNIRLILFFKYKYFIFTRNLILNFSYIVLSMRIALAYNPYLDYTIIIALEHKVCWKNLCRCIAVQLKIMKIVIFYKGRPSGLRERLNGPFFCRENVKLIFYAWIPVNWDLFVNMKYILIQVSFIYDSITW